MVFIKRVGEVFCIPKDEKNRVLASGKNGIIGWEFSSLQENNTQIKLICIDFSTKTGAYTGEEESFILPGEDFFSRYFQVIFPVRKNRIQTGKWIITRF